MTVAAGTIVYKIGAPQCSGTGLVWLEEDLDNAMRGPVSAILFDDKGTANIASILTELADTDFAREGVERILATPGVVEDWRVGEAIAEVYLTDHRSCHFPWPVGRDERKRGSSLPGADLVGLGIDGDGDCLAFGEVKTSGQVEYPPSSMYGRSGLQRQMEDLRDSRETRDGLLRYLAQRAQGASWRSRFKVASTRYLQNSSDVQLYGVLVRGVEANAADLHLRVEILGTDCPSGTRIELLALYLPSGSINGIGQAAAARRKANV